MSGYDNYSRPEWADEMSGYGSKRTKTFYYRDTRRALSNLRCYVDHKKYSHHVAAWYLEKMRYYCACYLLLYGESGRAAHIVNGESLKTDVLAGEILLLPHAEG